MLKEAYEKQIEFQKLLGFTDIPKDDPEMLIHNLFSMVTEIAEVATEDKRWKKNGRNLFYDRTNKKKEIADVFIFLLNVLIYSNITLEEFTDSVLEKQKENFNRFLNVT